MKEESDIFHTVKQKILQDLIKELKMLEYPADWKPRDVLWLIIRKLEDREKSC